MKAYFAKELPDQALYLAGKAYRFEVMETEDPTLIRLLDGAIAKRIGGVSRISEQDYLAKKKVMASQPSLKKQYKREEVRQKLVPQPRSLSRNRNGNAVAEANPTPAQVATNAVVDMSKFIPTASKGVLA